MGDGEAKRSLQDAENCRGIVDDQDSCAHAAQHGPRGSIGHPGEGVRGGRK
jgi:hypothetical protein